MSAKSFLSLKTGIRKLVADQALSGCFFLGSMMIVQVFLGSINGYSEEGRVSLTNPSFESLDATGNPVGWERSVNATYYSIVEDEAVSHTGKRCAKISLAPLQKTEELLWYTGIDVQPNTEYFFNAWAKSRDLKGQGAFMWVIQWDKEGRFMDANGGYYPQARSNYIMGTCDWTLLTSSFTTAPTTVRLQVRFYADMSAGTVWFDDLDVRKGASLLTMDDKSRGSKNLAPNSSFEFCTEPGLPDYWGSGHWGIYIDRWIVNMDGWRSNWNTDNTTAYDGKQSVRINVPDKPDDALVLRSNGLNVAPNKKYTVSVYLKGEPSGVKVSLSGLRSEGKEVVLTNEWKRYSVPFVVTGTGTYDSMFQISPVGKGTIWIDAFQLEAGEEATAYQPSEQDNSLTSLFAGGKGKEEAVPELTPAKVAEPPVIDGKLSDACWSKAKKISLLLAGSGEKPTEPTDAYLLYDKKGLYIGLKCFQASLPACEVKRRDGNVWADPCVEIFIDTKLNRATYYHLGLNAVGVQYDALKTDCSWNGEWQAKTDIQSGFWSAEMFIPFGDFGINQLTSETWGINICRENAAKNEYSAWSPTYGDFHTPKRFGKVKLDKSIFPAYYFAFQDLNFKLLSVGQTVLTCNIANNTGRDEPALLIKAEVKDASGEVQSQNRELDLKKGENKTVSVEGFNLTKNKEPYSARVSLLSADAKLPLASFAGNLLRTSSPLEAQVGYTYYTDEEEALLNVRLNLSETSLKGKTLIVQVKDKDSKTLITQQVSEVSPEMNFRLPIKNLVAGEYAVSTQLKDAQGEVIADSVRALSELDKGASEVKLDRFKRTLVVDGKPVFPFGTVFEGGLSDEVYAYLAREGFKFALVNLGNEEGLSSNLNSALKYGLKLACWTTIPRESGPSQERVKELIRKFSSHPAVLSWMIVDEPISSGGLPPEPFFGFLKEMKKLDPRHPVAMNENQWGISRLVGANLDFPGEIVSVDDYPYPPCGPEVFLAIGEVVRQMREMGASEGKPVWMILQSAGYSYGAVREPTPAEEELMTYASVINGATGIFYFEAQPRSKALWEKLKDLNREIKELAPVIFSTAAVPGINVSSPSVQVMVKEYEKEIYLITVNGLDKPVRAGFDLSSLNLSAKTKKVKVVFENREVKLPGNIFQDNFSAYQRHVYKISAGE